MTKPLEPHLKKRRMGLDKAKAAIRKAEWRAIHREKVKGYSVKYRAANREKVNAGGRAYGRQNSERRKHAKLFARYAIGLKDYERMCADQEGRCAICALKQKLYVDHHHATRKVRGLLCHHCNMAIGYLKENVNTIEHAAAYLRRWHDEPIDE